MDSILLVSMDQSYTNSFFIGLVLHLAVGGLNQSPWNKFYCSIAEIEHSDWMLKVA